MKKKSLCTLLVFLAMYSFGKYPTDNPYKTRYKTKSHWTDILKWERVFDARKIAGLVSSKGVLDSSILDKTMTNISKTGGGVLYFSEGNYYIDFDINIKSGVILRGVNPSIRDAKNRRYNPSSKFIFPKYIPPFMENATSSSSAFKRIYNSGGHSMAVVNLDINRAPICFWGRNIFDVLIFGIRSNNALYQPLKPYYAQYRNQGWQRYPMLNSGNFHIRSYNSAVANCRINDSITDDFIMPTFLCNDTIVLNNIKFQYGFSYGIYISDGVFGSSVTPKLELVDNYVNSYLAEDIAKSFKGKSIIINNNFVNLKCQNLIDSVNLYSKQAQEKSQNEYQKAQFISGLDTLSYFILKPQNYNPNKKYSLLLFFHAVKDLNPLVHFTYLFSNQPLNKEYIVIVPRAKGNGNFSAHLLKPATKTLENVMLLVQKVTTEYSVDPQKMFVAGLSSGGVAALEVLVRYPDVFNHAIIMSAERKDIPSEKFSLFRNVSFVISAGVDDNWVSIKDMRSMVDKLKGNAKQVKLHEYNGLKHWTWLGLCSDKEFLYSLINTSN